MLSDNEEPFAICSLSKITERFQLWNKCFSEVECFYAVKANNDPVVINHLKNLGSSFDCSSKNEIKYLVEIGVEPEKIIFSAPQKFFSHIKYAGEAGVNKIVFDCEEELVKIKDNYNGKPKCVIRIVPPYELTDYPHMLKKFGCLQDEALRLLNIASKMKLDIHGVCFHAGHCNTSARSFQAAIIQSRVIYDEGKRLGHSMELLDIGGGFPGQEGSEENFIQISSDIRSTIQDVYGQSSIKVIGEPGLFLVCNSISIYAKVIGSRQRSNHDQDLFLNCGVFSCVSNHLLEWYNPEIEVFEPMSSKKENQVLKRTTLWGPTCDPKDWIAEKHWPIIATGVTIKITNTGAYVFNRRSPEFSGCPNPKLCYADEIGRSIQTNNYASDLQKLHL